MAEFHDRRTGVVTDGSFKSMDDVKKRNAESGKHFFDKDSMRFFDSRVGKTLHSGPGGHYFVSSEQFHGSDGTSDPRAYSVRKAHPDGGIDTVGEMGAHPNRSAANRVARKMAQGR